MLEQITSGGAESTSISDFPWSTQLVDEVLFYSAAALRPAMADPQGREVLLAEIARALSIGPGVVVFTGAFSDDVIDPVSAEFDDLIEEARGAGQSALPPRDLVRHALERLAERNPGAFIRYYSNDVIALAAQSWLGPGYQLSSTVSVMNPGASALPMHASDVLSTVRPGLEFPAHARQVSAGLTLRGAVAHTDMPLESGPPMLLPHSHKKLVAAELAVPVPLFKGDAMFVNPAMLHGAGANTTRTVRRMANVLTITSALGRADDVNREQLARSLASHWESGPSDYDIANAKAAAAPSELGDAS